MPDRMQFDVDSETAFFARRDELVKQFAAWLPPPALAKLDPSDLGMLLDWKWGYNDGHLGRWRTGDLDEFLLGWAPRKLMAPADLLASVPVAVTFAMSFLAERGLLTPDSHPVERLTQHGAGLVEPFLAAMADPANFGMSKSIFSGLGVDDPGTLTSADIDRIMADFNAQPFEQRRAITDPALGRSATPYVEPVTVGPIRMPSDITLRASAEAAPVFDVFSKISDYFAAPGRVLTGTGNLKMVDARALTELLRTGDEEVVEVGDEVWRKRSASQFVELDHWQWWSREAGVVRVKHNRLVSVAMWRKQLRADPVAALRKAVGVLFDHGVVSSYRAGARRTEQAVDASASAILTRLSQTGAPEEYDELSGVIKDILVESGERELFPGHFDHVVDQLLTVLERAGSIRQHDVTRVERERGFGTIRTGGTVQVTPFGVQVAVDEARRCGIEVLLERDPIDLDVVELAALSRGEDVALDRWWDDAIGWLEAQPQRDSALSELLTTLDPVYLLLTLLVSPDCLRDDLAAALGGLVGTSSTEPTDQSAAALWWLLSHDPAQTAGLTQEYLFDSGLLLLELLADSDEGVTLEMLGGARTASEQAELLMAVVRRGRPRGLRLLEVVGRGHPDKTVAKLARKEAFRLRSKLGSH